VLPYIGMGIEFYEWVISDGDPIEELLEGETYEKETPGNG